MAKEFKTLDELIALLNSRGVATNAYTKSVLMAESYYAILNGYKEPFLDKERTNNAGDDRFKPSVTFDDIYSLFLFDRELRNLTFKYLVRAEAVLRNLTVYSFCEAHPDTPSYLDPQNYTEYEGWLLKRDRPGNMERYQLERGKLLSTLSGKALGQDVYKPFILHYRSRHGKVPLWVLSNDLTFGNIEHFFLLLERSVQNATCKHIAIYKEMADGKRPNRLTPKRLRTVFRALVDFRNICAHDERLYCAAVTRSKDVRFKAIEGLLADILPYSEASRFFVDVARLVSSYSKKFTSVSPMAIFEQMGYTEEDLTVG
jgi:abortive infection bacteriophage resistance protein